jgi:aldose sugar dehydrogenase
MRPSHALLLVLLLPLVATITACEVDTTEPVESAPRATPVAVDEGVQHFGGPGEVIEERIESEEATYRLVRVVGGLENPWGLTFLPEGRLLVTERGGRMSIVENGTLTQVTGLPEIRAEGQGGLLDVVLHPDYGSNGWIYFTYSAPGPGGMGTELARARLEGTALVDLETLYSMEPKTDRRQHFGSRIVFLGDGTLLFTIGDRGEMERAQDPADPAGSTIRINEDGGIPGDNPFAGEANALPELYTIGNRNSQGMAVDAQGNVWQTEHGPRGGDELNLIRPGNNYGWPEATYGLDYRTQEQIGVRPDETGAFVEPVTWWTPAIAPSGLAYYDGDAFPAWRGNLLAGSLTQQKVIRIVLDGQTVTHQEDLIQGRIGRIRDVRQGPDGFIYVINDVSDAGIYRLEPVEERDADA